QWILEKESRIQIERSHKGISHEEGIIRPATSACLGLAIVLKTGLFKEESVGVSEEILLQRLAKLIGGLATQHTVNGGTWGHHWQSSLWCAQLSRAAWLIWEQLDRETRTKLCRIIVSEAERHLRDNHALQYWNGKGGDSKAEEHSWDSMILQQAVVMMPGHKRVRRWKEACSKLMISAHSRKSDISRTDLALDGKTPRDWLEGYNLMEDGTLKNHDRIHNDYMVAMGHLQMQGFLACSLAGTAVPETTDFNFAVIYRALVIRKFSSPPYKPPGGTMYIPGVPHNYYPEGTDWSTFDFCQFLLMDTYAHVLQYDRTLPHKAVDWMTVRAEAILRMQSRHSDGHLYAPGEYDNYRGAEQMALWHLGDTYLIQWLADQNKLSAKGNWRQ
ncbi:MAG: hypothetical protein VCA38_05120, partial [Roseibacillus sp.]